MNGDLTPSQLRRALRAAGELAELRDLGEFPSRAARLLRDLIPCDHAGYNVIDTASGHASVVADPAEVVFAGGPEILAQLADQNPIVVRAAQGDGNVLRLSDHISRRALHQTELYHDIYRVVGLEYQLGVQLAPIRISAGRAAEIVGLSLARARRDFSEGDRQLLGALKLHFGATLERLHELALLRAVVTETESEQRWVLLIDPRDGTVSWRSEAAAQTFGLDVGDPLPPSVRMWIRGERARQRARPDAIGCGPRGEALSLADGRRLRALLVLDAYPELDALHLRAEPSLDAAALRALGLTQRQAEVHELALRGFTSQQIADALFLSRRTVEKHIEAIYDHLGVSNRAQAVAGTLRALHAVT